MPSERDLTLESGLTYLLKRVLVDLDRLHVEELAPLGITGKELGILLFLDGREPESQQQAARRLGIDRTTMVGLLDTLEAKGLLTRQTSPADRRRNVVGLTDSGRRVLADAVVASGAAERRLLVALDETEQQQARTLLGKLVTDLDRRQPPSATAT